MRSHLAILYINVCMFSGEFLYHYFVVSCAHPHIHRFCQPYQNHSLTGILIQELDSSSHSLHKVQANCEPEENSTGKHQMQQNLKHDQEVRFDQTIC